MKKRKTYLLNTSARSVTRSVIFTGYTPATGKKFIRLKAKRKEDKNYASKEESRKERRSKESKF